MTSAAPLQFLILLVAGWIGRRQGEAIEYLRAENRVLRARLGPKRLRFADAERRLLAQIARNLTDATAGALAGFGQLIVDRDPLYTAHFRTLLQGAGVQLLRLPSRSPNLNAYAERFVRSIKHECLRHIVPVGERHLRAIVREFVEHYHAERNHEGLGNVIPFPSRDSASPVGPIGRRERLGGILSFYQRKRSVNPSRTRIGTLRGSVQCFSQTGWIITPP